jgi:diadenosine tetraphosphate (Ap4A) HIT family hydrolase
MASRRPVEDGLATVDSATKNSNLSAWSLHPQLEHDTAFVGDLPLSRLLLANDANYPWLLLVPRRVVASEIIDLAAPDRAQLMEEVARVAQALKALTACHKLNVAAIGNMVPQLHVHIVARRRDDPAWPKPVWGAVPPRDYDPAARERFIAALRGEIGAEPVLTFATV